MSPGLSRRRMLKLGVVGSTGLIGAGLMGNAVLGQDAATPAPTTDTYGTDTHDASGTHVDMSEMLMGTVDPEDNGFDPMQMLVDWDYGTTSQLEDGRTLREYKVEAGDIEIQIAPGLFFPAWAFNARVPGPTLRCTEGDHLQIHFSNYGTHPHTMHFHGFHTADMDGIPHVGRGQILPGENFTYEFDADPFGCHLYHCHATPLKRHLHKGMYGAFIIDPKEGRPPAREFMMMMNAFDTNFDGENEIYAVNTVGHEFMHRPIPVKVGELVRIYLIN
ncbi:MAG: multicopper oxidase domain-containing protein, partial [Anaerolineae bacterium]|nr:multicopper oxidase domain-containing protein [Anaerolineae bacterium]